MVLEPEALLNSNISLRSAIETLMTCANQHRRSAYSPCYGMKSKIHQARRNDMKQRSLFAVASSQAAEDLRHFDEAAWPPVEEEKRYSILAETLLVNEMDVVCTPKAVDGN